MLTTLPITLTIVLIKYILTAQVGYEGLVRYSEVSLVVTGGIFLIGFMLAGTMSDYKESEKLPAELACALESVEDTIRLSHQLKGGFDLNAVKSQLHAVTVSIANWLNGVDSDDDVYRNIKDMTAITLTLEQAGVGAIASRVSNEQHNLRKLLTRISVIKNTGFLATGYAFLEILTVVVIALLLVSSFENILITMIVVSFVTHIYVYMIRLIRDIDQPFEYSPDGVVGAADVDLTPLISYQARARQRLSETA
jgi:hypothetical protein